VRRCDENCQLTHCRKYNTKFISPNFKVPDPRHRHHLIDVKLVDAANVLVVVKHHVQLPLRGGLGSAVEMNYTSFQFTS
jgi:hypothetical protein